MYSPTDDWKIPKPGDLFDKNKFVTEQHREELRSTLEWLQEWCQIKVKPQSRTRGQYIPKRHQIVTTAEATLQEGLQRSARRRCRRLWRGAVAAGPDPL